MKNQRTEVYLYLDNNFLFTMISKLSKAERQFVKELTAFHSDFKDRDLIIYGPSNENLMIKHYSYVMSFSQCYKLLYHPHYQDASSLQRYIALTNFSKFFVTFRQPFQKLSIDYKGKHLDLFFPKFDLSPNPSSLKKIFVPLHKLTLTNMTLKLRGSTCLYTFLSSARELYLTNVQLHCIQEDPLEETTQE